MKLDADLRARQLDADLKARKLEIDAELAHRKLEFELNSRQAPPTPVTPRDVRVPRLRDSDDIDVYLRTFEHLALTHKWEKSTWTAYLVPELTGKAREAYASLPVMDANNYDILKGTILQKYEIRPETFQQKFRGRVHEPTETVREWVNNLTHLCEGWIDSLGIEHK